jgi:hypothetical protein
MDVAPTACPWLRPPDLALSPPTAHGVQQRDKGDRVRESMRKIKKEIREREENV